MLALWIKSIEKTLIKITILILIFSVFLEIDYRNLLSYFIFLGVFYLFGFLYIFYKMSYKVSTDDQFIYIKTLFSTHQINYNTIKDFFSNEGYLQRKFNLMSIYIITYHKNYLLKDLPDAEKIYRDIEIELKANNISVPR